MKIKPWILCLPIVIVLALVLVAQGMVKSGEEALGSRSYKDYEKPGVCGTSCHTDIYQQWTQAMRAEQAKRLESAFELERQAIAEIEKALASL